MQRIQFIILLGTSLLLTPIQATEPVFDIPTKRESAHCPYIGLNRMTVSFSDERLKDSRGTLILNALRDDNRKHQIGTFVIAKGTKEKKITFNVGGCAKDISVMLQFEEEQP